MTVKPIFAWYDLWVGAYWDSKGRRLYVLPVPCFGIVIQLKRKKLPPIDWDAEHKAMQADLDNARGPFTRPTKPADPPTMTWSKRDRVKLN